MTEEGLTLKPITVSLDSTATPPVLRVDDTGGNKVPQQPGKQQIEWRLDNSLKGGVFVRMSDCRPGFEWISWPPPANTIFAKADIGPNGDSLTITDRHETGNSEGTWLYRLRVSHGQATYETTLEVDTTVGLDDGECADAYARVMLNDNPVIINR